MGYATDWTVSDLTDVTVVDSTTITGVTPAGTLGAKDVTVTNP